MCSSMHFLEDALENIEGLPEEVKRRCEQIRILDRDVERLRLEKQTMEKELWAPESTLTKDQKIDVSIEIMEKFTKMREISYEKTAMARRLALLLKRLSEKTKEYQEFYKCELEVDDQGCTAPIEQRFIREFEMRRSGRGLDTFESDESARCSPAEGIVPCHSGVLGLEEKKPVLRTGLKGRPPKNPFAPRTYSPSPYDDGRKKKRKDGVLSAYMRKKKEREREQLKLQAIHARREEERRKGNTSRGSAQVPQLDIASFCAQACGTSSEPSRDLSITPSGGDQEDSISLADGLADMLGSDDDFDPLDALDLFPSLPSPPREIMDALDDNLFSMDIDAFPGLGGSSCDNSQSPMYNNNNSLNHIGTSTSFGHHHQQQIASSLSSASLMSNHRHKSPIKMPPPLSTDTPSDRKKKITFGSSSDTSIHGRPRKLTDRAAEAVQQTNEKLKQREAIVQHQQLQQQHKQEQQENNESQSSSQEKDIWCYCRGQADGEMVACESGDCPIEWYHMDCIGMTVIPEGDYICNTCLAANKGKKSS